MNDLTELWQRERADEWQREEAELERLEEAERAREDARWSRTSDED